MRFNYRRTTGPYFDNLNQFDINKAFDRIDTYKSLSKYIENEIIGCSFILTR